MGSWLKLILKLIIRLEMYSVYDLKFEALMMLFRQYFLLAYSRDYLLQSSAEEEKGKAH